MLPLSFTIERLQELHDILGEEFTQLQPRDVRDLRNAVEGLMWSLQDEGYCPQCACEKCRMARAGV